MEAQAVQERIGHVAEGFAKDRQQRQLRRHLDKGDFDALAGAGFLLTGVPATMGGLWTDLARSTRPVSEILRTIARADASVALVSSNQPPQQTNKHTHPHQHRHAHSHRHAHINKHTYGHQYHHPHNHAHSVPDLLCQCRSG